VWPVQSRATAFIPGLFGSSQRQNVHSIAARDPLRNILAILASHEPSGMKPQLVDCRFV
jgi:hypothetical protein